MTGGHSLKVRTKKQQLVSLSAGESELYAAAKTGSEGLGIQSVAKDLGIACGLNLHLDATATMCLVNRIRQNTSICRTCGYKKPPSQKRFVTKKAGTNVNPADLMSKPQLGPKIVHRMIIMGFEFVGQSPRQHESHGM